MIPILKKLLQSVDSEQQERQQSQHMIEANVHGICYELVIRCLSR